MKKSVFNTALLLSISVLLFANTSYAYWIWTPETKKFTNPKNAVKDSPKEQFDWAMSFYDAKDYQRAAFEFDKLAKQYEFSDYASKSQYYVGLCNENMQKYYTAFENYQKAVDNFPHLSNTDEVLARQYAIGLIYLEKPGPKVLGNDIMAPLDRAVEIFKKVVENAPYGKHAEDAQFKLGEALKKSERYEEAVQAFHKIVEDYPNSKYVTKAMYEESHCAYRASLKPAYDAGATDNAIKTFEKFADKNKDLELGQKADSTIRRLKDNVAQKSFDVAQFYESQGKTQAAIIYYEDVINTYPDSPFTDKAKLKIETLKNPKPKNTASSVVSKKKPIPAIMKKNPWSPFNSFSSESKPKSGQDQKKKPWNIFSFGAKKKTPAASVTIEIPKVESTPQIVESPKLEPILQVVEVTKVGSTPQAIEARKVELAPQVAESPKVELVPQVIVENANIEPALQTVKASSKDKAVALVQEAPKTKSWSPFNFDKKKEPVAKEASKKKGWMPFSFGSKKEPKAKELVKKEPWKPFNFDTNKETKKP